jgi:hypothetical protein
LTWSFVPFLAQEPFAPQPREPIEPSLPEAVEDLPPDSAAHKHFQSAAFLPPIDLLP